MNATALNNKTQHALTFGAHEVKPVKREGQLWLSTNEVGRMLEYANPDAAVAKLYSTHADEFTAAMTKIIRVATAGGKQAVRFFSLRGAHLLGMFARTEKAKAFRKWVCDVLEREDSEQRAAAAGATRLSAVQKEELQGLCIEVDFLSNWWKKFGPAIEALSPELHGMVFEQFLFSASRAKALARELELQTHHKYFETYPWRGSAAEKLNRPGFRGGRLV